MLVSTLYLIQCSRMTTILTSYLSRLYKILWLRQSTVDNKWHHTYINFYNFKHQFIASPCIELCTMPSFSKPSMACINWQTISMCSHCFANKCSRQLHLLIFPKIHLSLTFLNFVTYPWPSSIHWLFKVMRVSGHRDKLQSAHSTQIYISINNNN